MRPAGPRVESGTHGRPNGEGATEAEGKDEASPLFANLGGGGYNLGGPDSCLLGSVGLTQEEIEEASELLGGTLFEKLRFFGESFRGCIVERGQDDRGPPSGTAADAPNSHTAGNLRTNWHRGSLRRSYT